MDISPPLHIIQTQAEVGILFHALIRSHQNPILHQSDPYLGHFLALMLYSWGLVKHTSCVFWPSYYDYVCLFQWLGEFSRSPGHGWTSHIYVSWTAGWQANSLVCVFIRSLGLGRAPSLTWFLLNSNLGFNGKPGTEGGSGLHSGLT